MGKKTIVLAGSRRIELSNLEKVLYPESGTIKAQIIEYYLRAAPVLLRTMRDRPLSLVRYPDGITGQAFFQKNRPDYVPEWMAHTQIGDIDYMMATEPASLVYLANLAALEFHQMQIRPDRGAAADHMIFDLDPSPGVPVAQVLGIAFELRDRLTSLGYAPFLKTSGGKGLHILVPLAGVPTYDEVFEAAKLIAEMISAPEATLQIKKERREKKILIDIYRNRPGQTLVCAYSLRARETPRGPCVSFPISWDELEGLESFDQYVLADSLASIESGLDAWQGMDLHAAHLHTKARTSAPKSKRAPQQKVEKQLTQYRKKRSFDQTPEPAGAGAAENTSIFVLHRHHASRLHYDLRIEENGTLRSWALPRGLPPRPGIKRLAVHVEDHPLEYASFEGIIPKGQYGAGQMWIFARGKCEILKRKADGGFYFRLHSEEISGDYRTFPTRANDWLIERLDSPPDYWHPSPMLAEPSSHLPAEGSFEYEVKWDGIRALICLDEGVTTIRSRNGLDLTEAFPELADTASAINAASAILDGEIVCLDSRGRPVFSDVIRRMQNPKSVKLQKKSPAVCCLFDCLYLDGRSILRDQWSLRRAWLKDIIRPGTAYRFSDSFASGEHLLNAAREHGLEGVMAKEISAPYTPGRRSKAWTKIKLRSTADCFILGWAESQSAERKDTFASLHLAVQEQGGLRYVGRVGTGMDDSQMRELKETLAQRKALAKPAVQVPALEAKNSSWIEPTLPCEVQYASFTKDGLLREPVFLRLRPDLERV